MTYTVSVTFKLDVTADDCDDALQQVVALVPEHVSITRIAV